MDIKYSIYPTLLDSFYWYKRFPDAKFSELIDKINKVKTPTPIAALKGVQFEQCVNNLISGVLLSTNGSDVITENFSFNADLINKIATKLVNAKKQQEFISGIVETKFGFVKVYGFVDYSFPKMYVDLKTTGNYKIGKYKVNNQHKAYSLISKINGNPIEEFNYLVTDFSRVYIENYKCTEKLHQEFILELEDFIDFLEYHRELITDKKIFNN